MKEIKYKDIVIKATKTKDGDYELSYKDSNGVETWVLCDEPNDRSLEKLYNLAKNSSDNIANR